MNLNSVLIGSEQPERLAAYYTKLFGAPFWEDNGFTGYMIGSGMLSVGPHDAIKGPNTQPGRLIWNIETPDVKSETDRLVAAGATLVQEPYQPGGVEMWISTFSDPDGNYFQLMSPVEM